ncbi:acyltransferase domain-containing protein, partial [Nocardia nepalensis]|uniref:acyltransferase domain-containing protein n=1 Tax=Nocardia nepalensis TaxID=3375448 RepID=UPI003B67CF15
MFVFPGQGSQWLGMGRELLDSSPVFAEQMQACAQALSEFVDWSLLDVVRGVDDDDDGSALDRVDVLQPLLWAVMVSLAELWRSYGVQPDAVVGHSQGEIAAAYVAGALSLRESARIVALRSKALQRLAGRGGMMSLGMAYQQATERMNQFAGRLSIAAVNGADSVVVSGDSDALDTLLSQCSAEGIRASRIAVDYASHSAQVEVLHDELAATLSSCSAVSSRIPFYSTVTGEQIDTAALDGQYWYRNLRQTVQFESATSALLSAGHSVFVEVSPHPVLTIGVQETIDAVGADAVAVHTLVRDQGGLDRFKAAVGRAHVCGVAVDWATVFAGTGARRTPLPTYAFQRQRFWLDTAAVQAGEQPAVSGVERQFWDAVERADVAAVAATLGVDPEQPLRAVLSALSDWRRELHGPLVASVEETAAPASLIERLVALPRNQVRAALRDLVADNVAGLLDDGAGTDVPDMTPLRELGFKSLAMAELRNQLIAATGLRLPTTLVFDYPTIGALAERLETEILGELPDVRTPSPSESPKLDTADDPVVIVAMGCRYPGGVGSPEDLWQLVVSDKDVVSGFPVDRGWDLAGLFDPDPDAVGKSYVRAGGFLDDAVEFDAGLFGISPREALTMDPQQRLLLETAWEVFEHAGVDVNTLRGSRTGVFVGCSSQWFGEGLHRSEEGAEGYLLTGTTLSVASGRVAYVFGLEGPAITVDTACSSSLVALHLAAQSLYQGECSMALAGGVTVMSTPGMFVEFSRQRGLAVDGRCKSFADAADGTGWSEGVGLLLLERLSDARRLGHEVLAVLRSSAVNQDGASNGLTAPNGPSQQRVIRQALANAGLSGSDVDAVEAHGTGTSLGDPIEAHALLATYGQDRPAGRPLWLGSIKSNIGHTQAAAGVAGVIKMVEALRRGVLPKTLHVDAPSSQVDWSDGAVELLTRSRPWPETGDRPRRAGVSSFGISGTNAHVVLEQVRVESGPDRVGVQSVSGGGPWLLSGRSAAGLRAQAGKLREFLAERPDVDVADVGLSLATTRTRFSHRGIVVGGDRERLLAGLAALAEGGPASNVATGTELHGKTVFVFPGQGSQWLGMGRELLDSSPVFAEQMQACAQALSEFVDWSLLDVVRGVDDDDDGSALDRVDVLQPLLWAVMVSLAELWRSYGVQPDAVVGHSQGEIAAAYVAGALSLRESARIVALRSKALQRLAGRGGMMSLGMAYQQATERMNQFAGRLSIAAVNGADSVVVSGDSDALDTLLSQCSAEGIRASRIAVDYASHSAQVEVLHDELAATLSSCSAVSSRIPFYSTVTGEQIDTAALDGQYWYRNLRQTVQFESATSALLSAGHSVFVEVSPHPVLTIGVQETIDAVGADAVAVHTLVRDQGGLDRFKAAVGRAHVCGVAVDWATVFAGTGARRTPLPTYAFQRQRFWLDTAA